MWFCFLQNERLDNKYLLFENEFMKNLKLQQVFDVIFEVHVNKLAILSNQIRELERRIAQWDSEIKTLYAFLQERNISDESVLIDERQKLNDSLDEYKNKLLNISQTLRGETDISNTLNNRRETLTRSLQRIKTNLRDRETLLSRLLPLRGQYAEEIRKLNFLKESKRIFDPLGIVRCPVCFAQLSKNNEDNNDLCFLCNTKLEKEDKLNIDITLEIKTYDNKLKELNTFILDIENEISQINHDKLNIGEQLKKAKQDIDDSLKNYISPYIYERDIIVGEIKRMEQEVSDIEVVLNLYNGIQQKENKKIEAQTALEKKNREIEKEREKANDRELVVKNLSEVFQDVLKLFRFPKLSDAYIQSDLLPFVRGLLYKKIGSSGALTLISLAWYISMFKMANQRDSKHPGFLMVDSPQKNIGVKAKDSEKDFGDIRIVDGIYQEMLDICSQYDNTQIIVVDNEPPEYLNNYVTIRFTGRKGNYPYGFIDDEEE